MVGESHRPLGGVRYGGWKGKMPVFSGGKTGKCDGRCFCFWGCDDLDIITYRLKRVVFGGKKVVWFLQNGGVLFSIRGKVWKKRAGNSGDQNGDDSGVF